MDAATRRVIIPKKGQQVFFAWKSRHGKLYLIESQYSQAYYKSDADGILSAFRAGSPDAYNVYKQLTQDVSRVLDKHGNEVTETRHDKKTGKDKVLYRWKLTGRDPRKGQSVSIHSVAQGFTAPLTRGFPSVPPREIPSGSYIKVPVTWGRKTKAKMVTVGRFTGDSIYDIMKHVRPDTTTAVLAKKRIKVLYVDGYVDAYRPANPYSEDSTDYADREAWANKIWKGSNVRRFSVAGTVSSLMNFASRIATEFRKSFSRVGLRVTSLVGLEEAEATQEELDRTVFRGEDPIWPSIIEHPKAGVRYKLSAKGKSGADVSARKYFPMRYEAYGGEPTDAKGTPYETVLVLTLSIQGF